MQVGPSWLCFFSSWSQLEVRCSTWLLHGLLVKVVVRISLYYEYRVGPLHPTTAHEQDGEGEGTALEGYNESRLPATAAAATATGLICVKAQPRRGLLTATVAIAICDLTRTLARVTKRLKKGLKILSPWVTGMERKREGGGLRDLDRIWQIRFPKEKRIFLWGNGI